MATDFKQILGVELETLGQIKETIKGLKEELQQYTVGSEQYLKVNTELQAEQKKLKAAMHLVKEETDLSKMSFNELNSQLASLKEAWKATADEAKRGELTTAINDVKARINEMNHSIGNFQDQVGNYAKGVEDAFKNMGISVTSLTAPLKKVGVDIEGMDTSIKLLMGTFKTFSGQNLEALKAGFTGVTQSVGSFVKGLSAIKAATLATGLGALLVLIGELIAHWDDLTDAVDRWIKSTNAGITTAEDLKAIMAEQNKEMDFQLALMRAMHKSEQDVTEMNILLIQQSIQMAEAKKAENMQLGENAKWHWTRVAAMKGVQAAEEELAKLNEELNKLLDKQAILMYASAQATDTDTKATKNNASTKQQLKEVELDLSDIDRQVAEQQAEAEKPVLEGIKEATKLRDEEAKKRMTDGQLLALEYEEKKALLKQYGIDTIELTANYEEAIQKIHDEYRERESEAQEKADKEKNEREKRDKERYKALMQARMDATMNMSKGTTTILKNLSSVMGENTRMAKGFAIAAATIDTIASAVSGFRAGWNQWKDAGFLAWMAPVQAALNATVALTAGFAEVQKIKSVDTSGSSSGGGSTGAVALAIPNIEGLSSPVDYTRQVTTETEKEEMNQNNRVYILESDIQQSNNRVKVREEETTF